jgi:O-antigen/teichoic acid export membrane protein
MLEKLSQQPTGVRIIKNFFSLSAANLISQLLAFITTAYLARILIVGDFGKIGFAQGIVAYFALFTDFGLRTVGTREVAKKRGEIKRYVNNFLALRFVLALASFASLLIFLGFINKPIEYKILIALFGLTLLSQVFLLDWTFQGIERMELPAISNVIRVIIYLILIFSFVKGTQLLLIPTFLILAYISAAIFLMYIFIKSFGWVTFSFEKEIWKFSIAQAIPLGLSTFILQIGSNSDIVLLGFMKSDEAVGWYTAAYKLILFPIGFAGMFLTAAFPVMARLHQESIEKLKTLVQSACKVMFFLGFPISVGGMILAPKLIPLIYSTKYEPSVLAFQILMGYVFIAYAYAPFYFLLPACNKQKNYLYSLTTGAFTNILLNLFLIPKYSVVGAAISTVVGHFVIFIMLYIYSTQNIVKVSIMKDLFMAFMLALVMGTAMTLANLGILGKFLVGLVIYLSIFIPLEGRKWARMYKEELG